jgi:hypothetical protein
MSYEDFKFINIKNNLFEGELSILKHLGNFLVKNHFWKIYGGKLLVFVNLISILWIHSVTSSMERYRCKTTELEFENKLRLSLIKS